MIKNEKGLDQIVVFIFLLPAFIMLFLLIIGVGDFWFKKYALTNANDTALDTIVKHGCKPGEADVIKNIIDKLKESASNNVDTGGFTVKIYSKINGVFEVYEDSNLSSFYNKINVEGLGRNDTRQDFIGIEITSKNPTFFYKVVKNSPLGWFAYSGSNEIKYQHYIGDEVEQWIK